MMYLGGYVTQLFHGATITLSVSIVSCVLGLFLGILLTFINFLKWRGVNYIVNFLTALTRTVPELLVLFMFYFGVSALLSDIFHRPLQINAFVAGILTLGIIFAAYSQQTFNGAFKVIGRGQVQSALALGMSPSMVFFRVLLPQVWQHALPGLGNLWLVILKDSAIVSLIGLGDLMNVSQLAAVTTHQPFKYYLIAAVVFLLLTSLSQILISRMKTYNERALKS